MIIYQTTTFIIRKCFKMCGHCGSLCDSKYDDGYGDCAFLVYDAM